MITKKGIFIVLLLLGLNIGYIDAQEVHSFTLKEAQAYAIENSYKARVAQYETEESGYQVKETMSIGLPQLDGNVDYNYNIELPVSLLPAEFIGGEPGEFTPIQFGTKNQMMAGATLRQLVFDGTYLIGLKGAKIYNEVVAQQQDATSFEVKKNTSNAYYLAVVAIENHKMLEDNLTEIEKQLFETEKLYENGLVEEQNVDQLQLNAGKVKIEVENAARQMIISRNMLKFQMGILLQDSIILADDIQELIQNAAIDIAGRYAYDVSQNIQFKVANTWVDIREMQVKLEKAKFLPSINALLNVTGTSYAEAFDYFNGDNWFGSSFLGVSMKVPIFSGMQRKSSLQRARINSLITQVQREQMQQSLNLELSTSNANFNQALAAFNISQENVEVSRKILRITNRKFQEGMATSFEVTQAQSQLINDQFNLVGSAMNLFEAKTKIDQILNN